MKQLQEKSKYTVYYLNDKVKAEFEPYTHIIDDYLNPESTRRAKEMIGHKGVFRLRADKNKESSAIRLLFTIIDVNKKSYMLFLAVDPHKEQKFKSTVLNPSWLKTVQKNFSQKMILEQQGEEKKNIRHDNNENHPQHNEVRKEFSAKDLGIQKKNSSQKMHFKKTQLFNGIWIDYNLAQEEILTDSSDSLYVSGMPGAGKTMLISSLLSTCYNKLKKGRIAYIAPLALGAREAEKNFYNNQYVENPDVLAEFWGLKEFIEYRESLHNRACCFIKDEEKINWLRSLLKKTLLNEDEQKRLNKKEKLNLCAERKQWVQERINMKSGISIKNLFNEFYTLAGFDNVHLYIETIGKQNTYFPDQKDRTAVAVAYGFFLNPDIS